MNLRDGEITLTGGNHATRVLPSQVIAHMEQLCRVTS
jgi:hypothetical protein